VKLPLILLTVIAVASFAAPLVSALLGGDPNLVDLLNRLSGPSLAHPLGTDELGRDVLLRLLAGGRVSLVIGIAAALAAAAVGTLIGLVAGYLGGWTDRVLMRGTDAVIALPLLPLLIVLAALDLTKLGLPASLIQSDEISVVRIVVLAVLVGWTTAARLVRGAALVTRHRDFVRAARSLGAGVPHILWVHILPNVLGPLIVATTLSVGDVILFESVLSFLGLGVQPPLSSWGSMLSNAQELITAAPLLAVYPGLMIFLTVMACNLLGDALQRRLDPGAAPRPFRRTLIAGKEKPPREARR
jgi:peptide/nickel transport system permease protein